MTTAIYIFTTLLFFIIAGISVLLAYKRGFFKSVIKLGITVVSLAISVLITLLSSAAFSSLAETIVKDGFLDRITSNDVLGDIIEASPTMTKFIFAIPKTLFYICIEKTMILP